MWQQSPFLESCIETSLHSVKLEILFWNTDYDCIFSRCQLKVSDLSIHLLLPAAQMNVILSMGSSLHSDGRFADFQLWERTIMVFMDDFNTSTSLILECQTYWQSILLNKSEFLNKSESVHEFSIPFFQGIVPQCFFKPWWMFHLHASFNVTLPACVVLFVSKSTVLCENVPGKFMCNRQILWWAEGQDRTV